MRKVTVKLYISVEVDSDMSLDESLVTNQKRFAGLDMSVLDENGVDISDECPEFIENSKEEFKEMTE